MQPTVFCVDDARGYRKAGPTDLIRLLPLPGRTPLFLQKWLVETFVYGLAHHEFVHLSGPTGSAKTSLIEAIYLEQANFRLLCKAIGVPEKPLRVYPVEMVIFDTPGELLQRRAIDKGTTYDEKSPLVAALEDAGRLRDEANSVIWLREMGRVHSGGIQGGLLDLMTKGDILLPGGLIIDGRQIGWVADSNYQAEGEATHILAPLDDALKRRFTINLTLDYPAVEQELQILRYLAKENQLPTLDEKLAAKVVALGQVIRRHRSEGNLQSLPPPTIYGYMGFLRMAHSLPSLSLQQVARASLLGNASLEDQKLVEAALTQVFGLQADIRDQPAVTGNLF